MDPVLVTTIATGLLDFTVKLAGLFKRVAAGETVTAEELDGYFAHKSELEAQWDALLKGKVDG